MSFTCSCGSRYFYGGNIQGGVNMDATIWYLIRCLHCDKKYLYEYGVGFKEFDPELVK